MGGIVEAVGSFLGGKEQAGATEEAARLSSQAASEATQLQKDIYQQTRADQAPWRSVGTGALNELAWEMGIPARADYSFTPETREQVRARLAPQYTNAMAGGNAIPMLRDPETGAFTFVPSGDRNVANSLLFQQQRQQPSGGFMVQDARGNWYQVGAGGVSGDGRGIDEQRLNAAVDAYMAEQATRGREFQGTGQRGALTQEFRPSDLTMDPGYQFRLSEEVKALERSAAARGGLLSGSALKGITRFSQDYGANEYQNAFNRFNTQQTTKYNRLANIAGLGQTANAALGQAGQNYASNVGNIGLTSAANVANAGLSGANVRGSMYQGIGNALGSVDWGAVGNKIGGWFGGGGGNLMNTPGNTIVSSGYDYSLY